MIGIIVAAHEDLSRELLRAASEIMNHQPQLEAVCFHRKDRPEQLQEDMEKAIQRVDSGDGVLILVDMYGGRPSRVALGLLSERHRIEVVTGVHLPMLVEAINHRAQYDLHSLAARVAQKAKEFIVNAQEYQQRHGRKAGS